jgi:CRISPR/Cas system-associated exonuclease Cas4 (RecB family)
MAAEVLVRDCLNCSRSRLFRSCDYNYPLLKLMVEEPDERVSPTRLQQCPRQVAIKRRYDYTVDPKSQWAKVRGTLMHIGLGSITGEGDDQGEVELVRELDGVQISGRADLLMPNLGVVTDWKTTAYIRKDHTPRADHIGQLSIYRWLAVARGWDVAYGELMYLDMSRPKRYVVELWDQAKVEAWIRERLPSLQAAYDVQAPLAPVLEGDDSVTWPCNYCAVQHICVRLAKEGK